MLALLRLPRPPLARSSRVPPSPLRPPPARLAALPATVRGWVGPLSGGGGVRVLDLPLPPTGMLAALGLAIRRPSPPSPPFAPDRSLSPPFAARAVLHAFIQSRASGHGLCAPSPLMGIASVPSHHITHLVTHRHGCTVLGIICTCAGRHRRAAALPAVSLDGGHNCRLSRVPQAKSELPEADVAVKGAGEDGVALAGDARHAVRVASQLVQQLQAKRRAAGLPQSPSPKSFADGREESAWARHAHCPA